MADIKNYLQWSVQTYILKIDTHTFPLNSTMIESPVWASNIA